METKDNLNNLIKKMLSDHEGGEKFFDNLDENLRDKTFLDILIKFIKETYLSKTNIVINLVVVSGKFGRFFINRLGSTKGNIVIVNGGLRIGEEIDNLSYLDLKGTNAIFIDDSFYSGKTRDIIKKELELRGSSLHETFVIYDGSKEKDDHVHSLYRYYDSYK